MQETDTFNPVPTTLQDFENFGLLEGDQMLVDIEPNGPVSGYLDAVAASEAHIETIPVIRANAQSGGRLSTNTFDELCTRIHRGLVNAGALDGLMVILHGAASAEGVDDVEGQILSVIHHSIGKPTPLALLLDHHANITSRMMAQADIVMGFRTQPHDPFETGRDLTRLAIDVWQQQTRPTMAWRKIPMVTHQEQYLTARGPMKILFDEARRMELDESVLTVSPFPMQPWLDVDEGGWSVVVVTNDNHDLAEKLADELADLAWSLRFEFMKQENMSSDDAVRFADDRTKGTILLSDTGDSVLGGAMGDSTVILESVLRLNPQNNVLIPMTDPVAARKLAAEGVGSTVTLQLGGWSNEFFSSVGVTGTVRAVTEGKIELSGLPQGSVDMGISISFDCGQAMVMVTEFSGVGGIHPDLYRRLGVEPRDYQMIVVKTASNFQYMKDITSTFVRVATPGPTQSDVFSLPWKRIPRPIFPIDVIETRFQTKHQQNERPAKSKRIGYKNDSI